MFVDPSTMLLDAELFHFEDALLLGGAEENLVAEDGRFIRFLCLHSKATGMVRHADVKASFRLKTF